MTAAGGVVDAAKHPGGDFYAETTERTATEMRACSPIQEADSHLAVQLAVYDYCQTDTCTGKETDKSDRDNTETDRAHADDNHTDDAASEVTTETGTVASHINSTESVRVNTLIYRRPIRNRVQPAVIYRKQTQSVSELEIKLVRSAGPFNCCRCMVGDPMLKLYPTQLQEYQVFDTDDPFARLVLASC